MSITGTVTDAKGKAVPGAEILAFVPPETARTRTDEKGRYSIQNLASTGVAELTVRARGFAPLRLGDEGTRRARIKDGSTLVQNVILSRGATVRCRGEAPGEGDRVRRTLLEEGRIGR